MALLAVTTSWGLEYINLSLAERILLLSDGSVEVQFSRTVITLQGVDAQRALQWAQQQAAQTLDALADTGQPLPATPHPHPTPTSPSATRSLDLPSFRAEPPAEMPKRTEPSWRIRER